MVSCHYSFNGTESTSSKSLFGQQWSSNDYLRNALLSMTPLFGAVGNSQPLN